MGRGRDEGRTGREEEGRKRRTLNEGQRHPTSELGRKVRSFHLQNPVHSLTCSHTLKKAGGEKTRPGASLTPLGYQGELSCYLGSNLALD